MLISGALQGFDEQLKLSQATPGNPVAAKLPTLDYTRWSDITTRVAGQSLISSGVNTAIYGGSFREKLTTALLSNVAGQIQAEGAGLIGDNGKVLGLPGKVLSHAVVAGISAEIGRGNARGAAAGALAAELAAIILDVNTIKPNEWQSKTEHWAQIARVAGAVSGAVFTGKSDGAYSGANSAESVTRFNHQQHLAFMYGEQGVRYFQGIVSLGEQMDANGQSPDEIAASFVRYAKGTMPEGQDAAKGIITAWGNFFGIPLDIIMSSQVLDMKKAAEIASSGVPTSETRLVQYIAAKSLLKLADTKYILKAEAELKKEISSFKSA